MGVVAVVASFVELTDTYGKVSMTLKLLALCALFLIADEYDSRADLPTEVQEIIAKLERRGGKVLIRDGEVVGTRFLPDKDTFVRKVVRYRVEGIFYEKLGILRLTGPRQYTVGRTADDNVFQLIKGLRQIEWIDISYAEIGDVGLEHLQGLSEIAELTLDRTNVTNAGIRVVAGFPKLTRLSCKDLRITNESLELLSKCRSLESLCIMGTAIDDRGLRYLKRLPRLRILDLSNTRLSDDGLAYLKPMTELQTLDISNTAVSDNGLARIGDLGSLTALNLSGTGVTDEGIGYVAGLGKLTRLDVLDTRVSKNGIARLLRSRPSLQDHIVWGTASVPDSLRQNE